MADTILITASLRIERSPDEVRAQYRDIDHHIRNNVHPGIHYQWEPAEPGQRKIRTTFRILGVPQFDVSLLEDGEDGSFLIRYLEGTNAGMVLVHKFVPVGEGATDVQLFADAPATLGRRLLGPLFVAGARQVMKKALAEDKRDLEGGKFKAGIAAGNLAAALAPLAGAAQRSATDKRALLEAACLVATADADVEASERDALARLAAALGAEEAAWIDARLNELIVLAATPRIGEAADRAGTALAQAGLAREGLIAALVIGLVSEGLSLGELTLVRRIATAAGVDEEQVSELVESVDSALQSAAR